MPANSASPDEVPSPLSRKDATLHLLANLVIKLGQLENWNLPRVGGVVQCYPAGPALGPPVTRQDAFERRLRDLAARDLIPSGPGGRYITEAVKREIQRDDTAPTGAP